MNYHQGPMTFNLDGFNNGIYWLNIQVGRKEKATYEVHCEQVMNEIR